MSRRNRKLFTIILIISLCGCISSSEDKDRVKLEQAINKVNASIVKTNIAEKKMVVAHNCSTAFIMKYKMAHVDKVDALLSSSTDKFGYFKDISNMTEEHIKTYSEALPNSTFENLVNETGNAKNLEAVFESCVNAFGEDCYSKYEMLSEKFYSDATKEKKI